VRVKGVRQGAEECSEERSLRGGGGVAEKGCREGKYDEDVRCAQVESERPMMKLCLRWSLNARECAFARRRRSGAG
jgi:hypothetical protein